MNNPVSLMDENGKFTITTEQAQQRPKMAFMLKNLKSFVENNRPIMDALKTYGTRLSTKISTEEQILKALTYQEVDSEQDAGKNGTLSLSESPMINFFDGETALNGWCYEPTNFVFSTWNNNLDLDDSGMSKDSKDWYDEVMFPGKVFQAVITVLHEYIHTTERAAKKKRTEQNAEDFEEAVENAEIDEEATSTLIQQAK